MRAPTAAAIRLEREEICLAVSSGNGAIPPTPEAIRQAHQFLVKVVRPFLSIGGVAEPWLVGARADGGLLMEWRGPGGALEVHVEPDGRLGYLWDGDGTPQSGYEEADGVSPSDIRQQLHRVLTTPAHS